MRELIEHIRDLPPFPKTIQQLEEAYDDPRTTAKEIEQIINQDPFLVADILRIANSPYYNFSQEIYDIRHAVVLFGLDQIKEFAVIAFLQKNFDLDMRFYGIDGDTFIKLSVVKSALARALYQHPDKMLLTNTAFLCDISKVILSKVASQKGLQKEWEDEPLNQIDDQEKEIFGFDTIELSCMIFENWNFDTKMIDLLKNFKDANEQKEEILFLIRDTVTLFGHFQKENLQKFPQHQKRVERVITQLG